MISSVGRGFKKLTKQVSKNIFINTADSGRFYKMAIDTTKRMSYLGQIMVFVKQQMMALGVSSIPLIVVTALFTGAVGANQAAYQFANMVPLTYLGTAICKSVVLELGPVLTALVLCGRIAASIAAEIGTMKTNEQIDAMEVLALDPIKYLILPRIIAGVIMVTVLTIFADFLALVGGGLVSVFSIGITSNLYLSGLKLFFNPFDIFAGLLKAAVFGLILTLNGCYYGYYAEGGALGVGKATMKAVVGSAVLVLVFDFIVTALLF